jgi:hypothetical protein
MRIEFTPVTVAADEKTLAHRADVVKRLDNLGHINAADGQINTSRTVAWQASIDGSVVLVDGFAIEQDGERVLLSLALSPDEISIRQAATPQASVPTLAEKRESRSTWGDGTQPDPREGIPDWRPETLGAQVARNAEATA